MEEGSIEWIWLYEEDGNSFAIGQDWFENWYYNKGPKRTGSYQPILEKLDEKVFHIQQENFKEIYNRIYNFDKRIEEQPEPKLKYWFNWIKYEINSKMKSNPKYKELINKKIVDILTNNYYECDIVLDDGTKLHLSEVSDFKIIKE